jgi:type I restriction enzyme, S subunit
MTQNNTLPDGWKWTTFGNVVAKMSNGITERQSKDAQAIPVTRIETISKGTIDLVRVGYLQDVSSAIIEKYRLNKGDILFSHINSDAHLGKTAIFEIDGFTLLHGMNLLRLQVDTTLVMPRFLHYLCNHYRFTGYFTSIAQHAVNQSSINQSKLSAVKVPLPPLPEQERIVETIESLFTQLDAGVAGLKRVQAALKRYKASVLKVAVEGRLVAQDPNDEPAEELLCRLGKAPLAEEGLPYLPEGWRWTRAGDLASLVTSGSRGWAKYYTEYGDLFLRVGNFDRLTTTIDLSEIVQVNAPDNAEGNRTRLKSKDVLITITADVGMVGFVDERIMQQWHNAYINQHVGLVRFKNTDLAIFIAYALASESLQKQFIEKQYGATKKGVNLDDLKSLQIALPPLAEQQRIVEEIERRLSVVQELEQAVSASLHRAERLRQSILKRAFEGRLVPQVEAEGNHPHPGARDTQWGLPGEGRAGSESQTPRQLELFE